jgi:hypothetical protein
MKPMLATAVAENGNEKITHQYKRLGAKKNREILRGIRIAAIGVNSTISPAWQSSANFSGLEGTVRPSGGCVKVGNSLTKCFLSDTKNPWASPENHKLDENVDLKHRQVKKHLPAREIF